MESKNYWSWNEILVHSDVQNPLYVSDTLASQSSVPHVMASVGRCQQLLASSGVRWRMPADMPNSHKGISAGIRWQMPGRAGRFQHPLADANVFCICRHLPTDAKKVKVRRRQISNLPMIIFVHVYIYNDILNINKCVL